MNSDFEGPSLWHGREVNSCTRCKHLRCSLVKSGRHPDYEYFCMHPSTLAFNHKPKESQFLKAVAERLPDRLEYFKARHAERMADVAKHGEFISNDSYTPETPDWCPVVKIRKFVEVSE